MAKIPYIPLYIGDWEQDLNACEIETEGAWLKVIIKMFKDEKSGIYKTTEKSLQILWKSSPEKVKFIIDDLILNKVCKIEYKKNLIIFYNRRMIKDCEISKKRSEAVQTRYKTHTKDVQNTEYDNESEIEDVKEVIYYTKESAFKEINNTVWLEDLARRHKLRDTKKITIYLLDWLAEQSLIEDSESGGLDRSIKKIKTHFLKAVGKNIDKIRSIPVNKKKIEEPEIILSDKEKLKQSCHWIIVWWNNYLKNQKIKNRLPYQSYDVLHNLGIIKLSKKDKDKYRSYAEDQVVVELKYRKVKIPETKGIVDINDQYSKYRSVPGFNKMVIEKAKSIGLFYWMEEKRLSKFDLKKEINNCEARNG